MRVKAQDSGVKIVSKWLRPPVLAWSTCTLSAALVLSTFAFAWVGSYSLDGGAVVWLVALLAFALVGGLVAARRPENPIGWIFCAAGLSLSVASFATRWSQYTVEDHPGALPFGHASTWLAAWSWSPGILVLFTFLLLLFPDGHLPVAAMATGGVARRSGRRRSHHPLRDHGVAAA